MKVDFHLHTPASSHNGDSIKWESTLATLTCLDDHNVKSFAFTDHNTFNSKLYLEAKKIVNGNMFIFPGVEIDILRNNGARGHVLVLFNPEQIKNNELKLERFLNKKLRKTGISINMLKGIAAEYEVIIIPHVGKSDFLDISDTKDINADAIEVVNFSHHNYKKFVKSNEQYSIVSFSDTHIWRDYPQVDKYSTFINFDGSFKDLKKQLQVNKNYTKGEKND